MIPPVCQTTTGRMLDLTRPRIDQIDFAGDIAPALSRIARFNGAAEHGGRPWTVLDHLVTGFDLAHVHGKRLQALWLLHDAHEAYIGDITSPVAAALEAEANEQFEQKSSYSAGFIVHEALKSLKNKLDAAIFAAAGVPRASMEERRWVALWDARMLVTERADLMAISQRPWGLPPHLEPLKRVGALRPAPREKLIMAFLDRLDSVAPDARRRVSAAALEPHAPRRSTRHG